MENVHLINLSSYNRPEVVEDKKKDYVAYGEDNNYYQYLIDNFINSTTNNATINGISQLIYGVVKETGITCPLKYLGPLRKKSPIN